MEKLKLKTKDLTAENIAKLSALFPNLITEVEIEGKVVKTINADKLKEIVGDYAVSESEVYELTWVGKQESKQKIVSPINKTLRPVSEDSVNFETTENLYLEGDNFEILKVLQESYLNKIKMIYIDPPYNTGKDFVYKDNFSKSKDEYDEESGAIDEEGNKLFKNTTTNGRFHSDWLTMMYERLVVAKDLLRDDGVIFISIDDNEFANLRKICDEVFGEGNFIVSAVRKRRNSQANLSNNISPIHEYVLCYSKSNFAVLNKIAGDIDETDYKNSDNDPRGPYVTMPCTNKGGAKYSVKTPTGKIISEEWRFKKDTYDGLLKENKIVFPRGGDGKPRYKLFLSERKESGVLPNSWWDNVASNQEATSELKYLFDDLVLFDNPKPTGLIKFMLQLSSTKNNADIILDFFSGSATTADAVMQLNSEDGGNRTFIMVQLPEDLDESLEIAEGTSKITIQNAIQFLDSIKKPHLLTEIGKERIRRAANKIKAQKKQSKLEEEKVNVVKLDLGFRVFRLDSSNMKDVYYNPEEIDQRTLTNFKDNIKEDRTDKDLLYQVLLDLAIPISAKVEEQKVKNRTLYRVNDNFLIACFDNSIDLDIVKEIAKLNPLRLVFKDSSFKDDSAKVNSDEYLKHKLPGCIVRVI